MINLTEMNYDFLNHVAAGLNQFANVNCVITGMAGCAVDEQQNFMTDQTSPSVDLNEHLDVVNDW